MIGLTGMISENLTFWGGKYTISTDTYVDNETIS